MRKRNVIDGEEDKFSSNDSHNDRALDSDYSHKTDERNEAIKYLSKSSLSHQVKVQYKNLEFRKKVLCSQ